MAIRPFRSIPLVALSSLALAAAACSDPITQPGSSLRPDEPHLTIASSSVDTFALNPTVTNVYQSVEGHRIVIPAYAICQLGTSYGAAHWNSACTPATQPITFTIATSVNKSGRASITVSPDVRFAPSKTVMAYVKDSVAASRPDSYIEYCATFMCVDEGLTDAGMKTYRDPATGYVYRRLKHFSGYNVVFGRSCEPSPDDPDCVDNGDGGATSKAPIAPVSPSLFSGYITTIARDAR